MILVVSSPDDVHAQAVLDHLGRRGADAALLDLSEIPRLAALVLEPGAGIRRVVYDDDRPDLDLSACGAAWWRRPQPLGFEPELAGTALRFALSEWEDVLGGLWSGMPAFWINDPVRDLEAHRKAYQMTAALEVGLRIPETLVTSSPRRAASFARRMGPLGTVFKAFTASQDAWRETRLLRESDLDKLDDVRHAPVIFQRYVEGVDVRVTVVGDRIFAAEIDAREAGYPADFRMNMGELRIRATELPRATAGSLLHLMRRLGIVYGAADFRRDSHGSHHFLEVNPAGQWLFVEEATGQPIGATLAELLHGRSLRKPAGGRASGRDGLAWATSPR